MAAADELHPDVPLGFIAEAMVDWKLVRTVRAGARAMREAGEIYLPKFAEEDDDSYERRVANTPFTNLYEDIAGSIASKPFSKEVKLQGTVPDLMAEMAEDIDLAGNNIHTFAEAAFDEAVNMGLTYILADRQTPEEGAEPRNKAQERAQGNRAFLRMIPVEDVLGVHFTSLGGRMRCINFRFWDSETIVEGLTETVIPRIRLIEDIAGVITSTVYEKETGEGEGKWFVKSETAVDATEIRVVPIVFGKRFTQSVNVKPPLLDLADKQKEHFQHSCRLSEIFEFACFPMLQAKGMKPAMETYTSDAGQTLQRQVKVIVGPRSVLYATNEKSEWGFVEPSGQSIEMAMEHLRDIEDQMRTIGMQPHMPQAGLVNFTATTTAVSAAKAHSRVQAWAMRLKDGLEMALVYLARWETLPETTELYINTDFAPDLLGDKDQATLVEMRATRDISQDTLWDELQRRDTLGPQFNKDDERKRLEKEREEGADLPGLGAPDADDAMEREIAAGLAAEREAETERLAEAA